MLAEAGFVDIEIGERCDTFAGAGGEAKARSFEVYGFPFRARKPGSRPGKPEEGSP